MEREKRRSKITATIMALAVAGIAATASRSFFYTAAGGGVGWLLGKRVVYPLSVRFRGTGIGKLKFFACYLLVVIGFIIIAKYGAFGRIYEWLWGGDINELDTPLARTGDLWSNVLGSFYKWLGRVFADSKWVLSPSYSTILNFPINVVYIPLKFAALFVVYIAGLASLSAFCLAFTVFYLPLAYSTLLTRAVNEIVSGIVFLLIKAGVWVMNDLFKASIHYYSDVSLPYGYRIKVICFLAVYAFVPAFYLRYLVFKPLWYIAVKPVLTLYAIIFYGRRVGENSIEGGFTVMRKKSRVEVSTERTPTKQYKMIVPARLSRRQLRADIKRYSGDRNLLGHYFESLAVRFKSKTDRKVLQEEINRFNLEKEWSDALRSQRISDHQLWRVDMEEEVKRQKLEDDLELAKLSKDVKRAELEASLAKFQADKARHDAQAKEYQTGRTKRAKYEEDSGVKKRVKRVQEQAVTIEEARGEITEQFKDDPERMMRVLDEFDRMLVDEGVIGGDEI